MSDSPGRARTAQSPGSASYEEQQPLLYHNASEPGGKLSSRSEDSEGQEDAEKGDVSNVEVAVMLSGLAGLVVLGVTCGMVLERWSFITSLYVVVQLMTTIGYGDFVLSTSAMKLVFSFIGCCTLVIYICIANKFRGDWHKDFLRHQLEKVEAAYVRSTTLYGNEPLTPYSAGEFQDEVTRTFRRCNKLIVATVPALLDITFGTLFYANYEACTCSYGASRVPGCIEDSYEDCVKSGGYTKTLLSAFYMSVMTLLTVGFGDYSPRSRLGRAVGIVWMLTGVASMANWLRELSNLVYASFAAHGSHKDCMQDPESQDRMASIMDARDAFAEMDNDGDGRLSRSEFRMYFLLRQKLVSREALKAIDRYFDDLDRDGSNFVTSDEVVYAQMRRKQGQQTQQGALTRAHTTGS